MNETINTLKQLKNQTIIVATSGGPDSMALLHMLIKLKQKQNLKIICAHVNHNLRKESKQEEDMVKQFCKKNNISCEILTIKTYNSSNIESDARKQRYQFFEKIVKKCQANYLLTAHHGDDLIETILMRLTRGSTLQGYQGFKKITNKKTYKILRPLITTTKQELLTYCKNNNIPYAIDKTNISDKYTRNRYRKYILPKLKQENKNVHQKFYTFSKTIKMCNDYIQKQIKFHQNKIYKNKKLNLDKLKELDKIIQIGIIQNILKETYQNDITKITNKHTEAILNIINNKKPNQIIDLPNNKQIIKSYSTLTIEPKHTQKSYKIKLENQTKLPNNKIIKIVKKTTKTDNTVTHLNTKQLKMPLYVRNKQEGDTIEIKGLNGSKKIKQIFINEKIPKEKRQTYPVLVDSTNKVVWLPGLKKSKFDKQKEQNYDIILEYI